jgi:SAM-dependent methyltransferase
VTAIDRDEAALRGLARIAETLVADLESAPWPLPGRSFDAVVVTNYLWRPLLPAIVAAVGPGGVLIYETFAQGNETVGRPARPDFLLAPGELLRAAAGLRIVAYEDGFLDAPERFVQRVVAVREGAAATPARHLLQPPGR